MSWITTFITTLTEKVPPSGAAIDRRRTEGRELPYRTLRGLAKLYMIGAPLVLATMILVGIVSLGGEAPLAVKFGSAAGIVLLGALYYLIMKSIAQAIYLLFDIARSVNQLCALADPAQKPAGSIEASASAPGPF